MVGHVAFEYAPISLHEEAEVQFIRHVQFTSFWIATMRIKGQQTTKLLRLFWFPRHCCCGPQVIEKPERIMLLFNPHLISLQKCLIPSQELQDCDDEERCKRGFGLKPRQTEQGSQPHSETRTRNRDSTRVNHRLMRNLFSFVLCPQLDPTLSPYATATTLRLNVKVEMIENQQTHHSSMGQRLLQAVST